MFIILCHLLITIIIPGKNLLDKVEWRSFPLVEKRAISHNTALYRFGLPSAQDSLDLPIGQHVSAMAVLEGKEVFRSYTPTSLSTDKGFFDLVVKAYPTGLLSKHFGEMQVGNSLQFRGPKGNFLYKPNMCRALGMIAGGTGITPMLQVLITIQ
jgi:cytochrome-b5 reductase